MKTLLSIFILFLTLSCDNDIPYSEVPSVVENTFKEKFRHARDVEWETSGDAFEVEFEVDNIDHKARIDSQGGLILHKYDVDRSALPKALKNVLASEFPNAEYGDLERVQNTTTSFYQIEIDGFLTDKKMVLDSLGNKLNDIKYWN